MTGGPFFTEIRNGEEYGNDQCREELEIGGGKSSPDNDGQDEVIGHGTQRGGKKPQGEVFALAEQGLADDDGGQADADGAYGHVAVLEKINADGSIEISESNAKGLGVISTRTFSAAEAGKFQYVHY